jgi:hypothetical protein
MDCPLFFSFQEAEDDESDVQCILGHRTTNGIIEYLVRYSDRRIASDQWVKSIDLTCYHKILEHYKGRVPADIEIRPPVAGESMPPIPPPDENSTIRIVGFDTDAKGDTVVRYEVAGVGGVRRATRADFSTMHQAAFVAFLEKTSAKRT